MSFKWRTFPSRFLCLRSWFLRASFRNTSFPDGCVRCSNDRSSCRDQYENRIWSVDFDHDRLSNGRLYRMLTVIDEYTREALTVTVKSQMGSADVLDALYPLTLKRAKPDFVRSDNGREFTATALQGWLNEIVVKPIQIYPGSPWENGYNERFHGTLRREAPNAEWFANVEQAKTVIGKWLCQYNYIRPHQASACARQSLKLYENMAYMIGSGMYPSSSRFGLRPSTRPRSLAICQSPSFQASYPYTDLLLRERRFGFVTEPTMLSNTLSI